MSPQEGLLNSRDMKLNIARRVNKHFTAHKATVAEDRWPAQLDNPHLGGKGIRIKGRQVARIRGSGATIIFPHGRIL